MASKLRLLALLYYLAVTVAGLLVSLWISSVHRAPLPREEIERLAEEATSRHLPNLWSKDTLEISGDAKAFNTKVLESFSAALSDALGTTSVKVGRLRAEGPAPCVDASSTTACLEALEGEALSSNGLRASFELVLVNADSNTLILGTGRRAFLWLKNGHKTADAEIMSTAKLLKESWFRRVSFDGGASLFEITPGYVFSFFLLGDCASRISWDFFHAVLVPYLSRILRKLRILFDIEWNSQVVLCGSLGNSLEPSERSQKQNVVDVSLLQADFMRRTGEWPPDALTRDARWLPPLVRFVAFKPSEAVLLVDEDGESRHSFAVQGFGAVAIAQCEGEASNSSSLSDCEAQGVASGWISSVRSWLSLPADGSSPTGGDASLELFVARPRIDGIADWELQILARAAHAHFVQRTAETLRSLVELVDSLPDVVVREEIAAMAFQAVAKTRASTDAASQGDVTLALAEAREALVLALTAIHDDSVVSQLYFSWEFKYAVYLPISMPILVPLVTSLWRQMLVMLSSTKRLVKRAA